MASNNFMAYLTMTLITSLVVNARLDSTTRTYDEASRECEARNSWLVRIKSAVINAAVFNLISKDGQHDDYWIGARELNGIEGQWRWNDGTTLSYTNWDSGEPNEFTPGEDCLGMFDTEGTWNDLRCTDSIGYVCQSDLNPVIYVGAIELSIMAYIDDEQRYLLSYNNARSYCQNKRSKLVEIKTEEIQTALNNTLNENGFDFSFWTSGNDIDREGSWKWGDGTDIPLPRSSQGYENWREGRPNGVGQHDCLFLAYTSSSWQWDDFYCTRTLSFICQKNWLILSPIQQNISLNAGQNLSVSLNVTSYNGLVKVRLFKEPSATVLREFFNIGNTTISFNLTQVTRDNAGVYRFDASSDFTKYKISSYAMITIYDYKPPVIQSVTGSNCSANGRVTITWIPGNATYGVNHRFILSLNNSQEVRVIQNLTSSNGGVQTAIFSDLQPTTKYQLQVKVCPDKCIESLTVDSEVITGTLPPGSVERAILLETNRNDDSRGKCVIKWSWSTTSAQKYITGFQINLTSTIVHLPSGMTSYASNTEIFLLEENQTQFHIPTSPNRNYTAQIQAVTYACHGPIMTANGSCLTMREAPAVVPAPTIIDVGRGKQRNFTAILPDEANGPIRCIFVIMRQKVRTDTGTDMMFSAEELRNASVASSQTKPGPDKDYIALAFQRSNFTSTNMEAILGDNSVTSCDVGKVGHTRKKRQLIQNDNKYEGKNFPLESARYRIFIVSATPSDNDTVLFKTSKETILNNNPPIIPPKMNSQTGLIIGLGAGVVLLTCIFILLVILLIKRYNINDERPANENILGPMSSMQSTETETTYNHLSGPQQMTVNDYDQANHIEFTGINEIPEATYDNLGNHNPGLSTTNNYDIPSFK